LVVGWALEKVEMPRRNLVMGAGERALRGICGSRHPAYCRFAELLLARATSSRGEAERRASLDCAARHILGVA